MVSFRMYKREVVSSVDESMVASEDLVQVARLAALGEVGDARLLIARLVRRYRQSAPALSAQLAHVLERPAASVTRRAPRSSGQRSNESEDVDALPILRAWASVDSLEEPVFDLSVRRQIQAILDERSRADELARHGLEPISSAIFVGPPGVGKTETARWISQQLSIPLFSLDLTAVMSSRLGQSGANLRYALDAAKGQPSILFLDEIDSIAKRRGDNSDVGELKRLVTIMLQELDDWPSTSLLLAATNHPELVDPALWRRFGAEIEFSMPDGSLVEEAIVRFLRADAEAFRPLIPVLARLFEGVSFSDIERSVTSMRKAYALGAGTPEQVVGVIVQQGIRNLNKSDRIHLAVELSTQTALSQHQIARMTTISRDTIRKHSRQDKNEG